MVVTLFRYKLYLKKKFAKYLDFVIAVDIDTGACLTTR